MSSKEELRDQRTLFRELLLAELRRELVGPEIPFAGLPDGMDPPQDLLQESPVQRYSAGVLFPACQEINEVEASPENVTEEVLISQPDIFPEEQSSAPEKSSGDDRMSEAYDETVRLANEFFPSAIGLTFIASISERGLEIRPRAATYQSRPPVDPASKLREWHRTQLKLDPVPLVLDSKKDSGMGEAEVATNLKVRYLYHRRTDGQWLITVSMLNAKQAPDDSRRSGSDCFFQAGFEVRDRSSKHVIVEYRASAKSHRDPEEAKLELLYRNRKAFASGHGCAADWGTEENGCVSWVATSTLPAFKVAPVEPRIAGGQELSMYFLAGAEGKVSQIQVVDSLKALVSDYESWVKGQEAGLPSLPDRLKEAARGNLDDCRTCLERMRVGIKLLQSNVKLREAFVLANRAILMQQYHSRRPRRGVEDSWCDMPATYAPKDDKTARWRSFQLAFILINLRSIVAEPDGKDHPERLLVDLIWFPTGGGKTEAYLGLSACDIFFRRLSNPQDGGCTVLMRYTLRLLTSQQFQRAASMICACELLRRSDPSRLGEEPISIGLWVGESLTPTRREDAVKALNGLASKDKQVENPFQLLKCPWCGTELDNRKSLGYVTHGSPKSVAYVCPAKAKCPFSSRETRLPVLVVDEDLYATPPTLLIGTVDKFAMLAWRADAGKIFGLGVADRRPPDLIIQDELHLISGPLGSVVGLYEGAIDLLCSWNGRPPKIVASTATIRRAGQQCQALYDRKTSQFPPQGTDISDSFFARENTGAPGRVYAGVFASAAPSFVTAMVNALSSLFQGCRTVALPTGAGETVRDPYWTVLQYFNSLRELGHAATLVEADIPEHMWAIASRDRVPKELCRRLGSPVEMTSRLSSDEIPKILERLTVEYPRASDEDERPLDTLLATNMISVGVDVDRLGLMVMVGQPKTTSEYIQASSRVGRTETAPGLIVAMYNPGKPRDRSHYEHFRGYHSAFYKHVEPTSVTPYSLPVQERALHALLVIVARQLGRLTSPNQLDHKSQVFTDLIVKLKARCARTDEDHADVLQKNLERLLRHWASVLPSEWGRFGDPPESRPLMYPAGTEPLEEWDGNAWSTPMSMRNVDMECHAQVVTIYPDPN